MNSAAESLTQSLPAGWKEELAPVIHSPSFASLAEYLSRQRAQHQVYPAAENVFRALQLTPLSDVRAVILGQDPYHGPGQAHGLSFSVAQGVKLPPSLANIFRELHDDLGMAVPAHGCLEPWAQAGVLLLNTVLTVRSGQAHSHRRQGWETFTDAVLAAVSGRRPCVAFLLWGKPAASKAELIDGRRHIILTSAHPSPLSARRGFLGSRPFSRANQALIERGHAPVDWTLDRR